MPKPLIRELVSEFIHMSFTSIMGSAETWRKLDRERGPFAAEEKLILALFDLVEPSLQAHLLEACKQLHVAAKSEQHKTET